jgi:hypothetical protein
MKRGEDREKRERNGGACAQKSGKKRISGRKKQRFNPMKSMGCEKSENFLKKGLTGKGEARILCLT